MQHIATRSIAGVESLVLRPSCNLDALPLAALQPLAILRSLELPCVFDQPRLTTPLLDGLSVCHHPWYVSVSIWAAQEALSSRGGGNKGVRRNHWTLRHLQA